MYLTSERMVYAFSGGVAMNPWLTGGGESQNSNGTET